MQVSLPLILHNKCVLKFTYKTYLILYKIDKTDPEKVSERKIISGELGYLSH